MGENVIDRYSYLVFSLLLAQQETVAATMRDILRSHGMLEGFELKSDPLDLDSIYIGEPPAGGAHLKRAVIFSPKAVPAITVFVSNLHDGWQTMVNCLSKELRCSGLRVLIADKDQKFPTVSFEYIVGGAARRTVFVQKDEDGWKFVQQGEPLPFEDTTSYKRRLIRDRLNRSHLVNLLRRGGWDVTRREFWETSNPATYAFERVRPDKRPRGLQSAGGVTR